MTAGTERPFLRSYGALAAFILLLVAAVVTARSLGLFELADRERLADAIQRVQGVKLIAVWFVLAYALVAGVGLPATPLTLAGGAIFGTALGSGLNWLGAVAGATISHFLAKQLGSAGLKRLLGRNAAKLESLSKHLTFATILRLRLIPLTPFNLLNFASGLARVPLRAYVPATAIGILPGTIIYTFFSASLIGGVEGAKSHALLRLSIAGGLLILISFVPKLFRREKGGGAAASVLVAALLVSGGLTAPARSVAQPTPTAPRLSSSTDAATTFDHSDFDRLLHEHVVDGLVDYDAFEQSADFHRYLGAFAAAKRAPRQSNTENHHAKNRFTRGVNRPRRHTSAALRNTSDCVGYV